MSASDAASTIRAYDDLGNVCAEYDATGHERQIAHDLSGRVTEESGDAVYPTRQSYDALGRRVSLSTTRNGTAWDVTRWGYDPATGLCTNKTYADGSLVAHTFTADGLPLRTTFASGRWTQNSYDANRRLSSVSTSDGEGNVSYLYDAFGRVTRATGGAARYDYSRDALGRVTSEVRRTGGIRPTVVSSLSRPYDAFGRPAGYGLTFYGDFRQGVCYTWDMDGKLAGMVCSNAQGRAVEVSFDWDRGRGVGWGVEGLDSPWASFSQSFRRDAWRPWLVDRASAGAGFHGDSRTLQYSFDRLGRPVSRSGDAFAYNPRGEVTNTVLDSAVYRYAYDTIGNRESVYEDGRSTVYQSNTLNEYTNLTSNLSPLTSNLSYDEDGNLVDDGTRTFEWSASGRLTEAATPSARLSCVYDHLGRRVSRTTETRSGFRWNLSDEREFVYDGWNLIHERRYDYQDDSDTDIEYFWGPDLSGTLQGAGGVGGLVAVSVDGSFYFPGYDNNGNVIGYWDEDGDLVAEYAYDAFGNTISATGTMASVFPHRFSTKYYDSETDLYYYGYRYYSPSLGRWISRDPIGEEGGINLFSANNNQLLSEIDFLGCKQIVFVKGDGSGDEVSSVADIPHFDDDASYAVFRAGKFYDYPKGRPNNRRHIVLFTKSGTLCQIQLYLWIGVASDVAAKAEHKKDEKVGYLLHYEKGGSLRGGKSRNSIFPETLAHEQGHAKAYLEVFRPVLERELRSFFDNKEYKSKEQKDAIGIKITTKIDKLARNALYSQRSAQYANEGTVGYYSNNPDYKPVFPPQIESEFEGFLPDQYDHVWQKQ